MMRPPDPMAFIENFMLINKETSKNMEDILKDIPKYHESEEMDQDLLMDAGEYSGVEHNEEGEEQVQLQMNNDYKKNDSQINKSISKANSKQIPSPKV